MILGLYSVFRPAPSPTSWGLPNSPSTTVDLQKRDLSPLKPACKPLRRKRPARGWFYRLMAG